MSLDFEYVNLCIYNVVLDNVNVITDCSTSAISAFPYPPPEPIDPSKPYSVSNSGTDYTQVAWYKANRNFVKIEDEFDNIRDLIEDMEVGEPIFNVDKIEELPDTIIPNSILFSNAVGDAFNYLRFGSDSDLDPSLEDTITFDYSQSGKLIIKANLPEVDVPEVGSETIDLEKNYIFNSGYLTQQALDSYNTNTGKSLLFDDSLIPKRYADINYYSKNNPIFINDEQNNIQATYGISTYTNGYVIINNHGLNTTFNGLEVSFSTLNPGSSNLSTTDTYYIRYKDDNRISLHSNKEDAIVQDDTLANATKINVTGNAPGNQHIIEFIDHNINLSGSYFETQAVPRKDVVLRTGDKMVGTLILNDHPAQFSGESQNDDDLQAATVYYVKQSIESNTGNSANEFSSVSWESGDLLCSTGMRRLFVEFFNPSGWNVGESFEVNADSSKNGILHDIKPTSNNSIYILTYSTTNNHPVSGDRITNGTYNANVLGSFDEIAQVRNDDDSHISISVTRNPNAEYLNNDPVSNVLLKVNDNTIKNEHVASTAQIAQYKLSINNSPIFIESDNMEGWNSVNSYKKSVIGLSAFSNENFESYNGFVRIKEHGIALTDIGKIPHDTVLGTTSTDDNNVIPLSFSYIIEQGGGITENNFHSEIFNKFDPNTFKYISDKVTLADNGVMIPKLQHVNPNTVLGRKTPGFGPVEVLSIDDILSEAGGIDEDSLGDTFNIVNDKLELKVNSISLDKLGRIPSMTVLGNNWNTEANVRHIPFSDNAIGSTIVYRKGNGEINCNTLQLDSKKILDSSIDSLMAYTPTGQLIFTSLCGETCDFYLSETEFNGSVSAVQFNETSDERKKTNIEQIDNAINLISKLRGVTFNWKHNNNPSMGLIAQELEKHIPSAVNNDKDGYKNISYTNLIGLLVEGIKELTDNNRYTVDDVYDKGTVVVIGDETECITTNIKNNTTFIGVIKYYDEYTNTVTLFDKGKASCKVLGKVEKGDMLVTSSIPGYAIVNNDANFASIIGKSLTNKTNDKKELIEIVLV